MKVSLCFSGTKIETLICEMSILFTVFTPIHFDRTVEIISMFGITALEQVKSLLLAWYCGLT